MTAFSESKTWNSSLTVRNESHTEWMQLCRDLYPECTRECTPAALTVYPARSDCKSWVPLVLYYIANSVSLWIARFDASFQSDTLEFSPGPLVLLGIYIVENKHPVFNTSAISDSAPQSGGLRFQPYCRLGQNLHKLFSFSLIKLW
jgi:hypothetical protein